MKRKFLSQKISSKHIAFVSSFLFSIFLALSIPATAHATGKGAVTAEPVNTGIGVVASSCNGIPFKGYTYADSTARVTVGAVPYNKEYVFTHWTDNGIVVSKSDYYSFNVGTKCHRVLAHFERREEYAGRSFHSDKIDSSFTPNVPVCTYSSGYSLPGMALNTTLVTIDDATKTTIEASTGGGFVGAFRIHYSYGYPSTEKQVLDQGTRLVLQLTSPQSNTCAVTLLDPNGKNPPVFLTDLDTNPSTVTFDSNRSGIYVITSPTVSVAPIITAPVTPAPAATVPATAPAIAAPAAPVAAPTAPITEAQYQQALIDILRYQLQQAGITPAA